MAPTSLQSIESPADRAGDSQDLVQRPGQCTTRFVCGDILPARMTDAQLMRELHVSPATFRRRLQALRHLEALPKIGRRAWCGPKVERFLLGESFGLFGRKGRG